MNPFDRMYEGSPPWEIGKAQPAVEELIAARRVVGDVLDVGCGTGEHTMLCAKAGHVAWGIDASGKAIKIARSKATQRRVSVRFMEHDALELGTLARRFDTLIDSALFHVFTDEARVEYARSLEDVARPGTTLHVICFSEDEPRWGGPRRVSETELRKTFSRHWVCERMDKTRYLHSMNAQGAQAWSASFVYVGARTGAMA